MRTSAGALCPRKFWLGEPPMLPPPPSPKNPKKRGGGFFGAGGGGPTPGGKKERRVHPRAPPRGLAFGETLSPSNFKTQTPKGAGTSPWGPKPPGGQTPWGVCPPKPLAPNSGAHVTGKPRRYAGDSPPEKGWAPAPPFPALVTGGGRSRGWRPRGAKKPP